MTDEEKAVLKPSVRKGALIITVTEVGGGYILEGISQVPTNEFPFQKQKTVQDIAAGVHGSHTMGNGLMRKIRAWAKDFVGEMNQSEVDDEDPTPDAPGQQTFAD